MNCVTCTEPLVGKQRAYCSISCRTANYKKTKAHTDEGVLRARHKAWKARTL